MFLNKEQVKAMTGAKRPKEAIAWLGQHAPGRFRVGVDGWPVVHEKVAEELFGVGARARTRRVGVRLDHLKGDNGKSETDAPRAA
jgi:hypothetical protein